MQRKTAIGFALALLARDIRGEDREALFAALAPSLRDAVKATMEHVEMAPSGSPERAARMTALVPLPAPLPRWPRDPRVAAIVAPQVDAQAARPYPLPLPRRRYRVPQGLKEALLHILRASTEPSWPA